MNELNEMELREVNGGSADAADKALGVLTAISFGCIAVGLIATGPVGVAVGIMGSCLGFSSSLAGMLKAFAD